MKPCLAALTIAALTIAAPILVPAASAQQPVSYATRTLDGDSVRVGAGERPTLLAVFATWCRECRAEFAALDTLRRRWEPRGVRVVAVSVDEGSTDGLRRWVAGRAITVPVAHDTAAAAMRAFGVVAVPTAFVVGGDGRVLWRGRGALRVGAPGLAAALEESLRQPAAR
jgi:peroxiredoxin